MEPEILHPNPPQNLTGVMNSDGSITVNFDAVPKAQAYISHYGEPNEADKSKLTFMGYSETNSWTLSKDNVPSHSVGDTFHIYLQTYNEKGQGSTDTEKAAYLHDGQYTGSSWSLEVVITAK